MLVDITTFGNRYFVASVLETAMSCRKCKRCGWRKDRVARFQALLAFKAICRQFAWNIKNNAECAVGEYGEILFFCARKGVCTISIKCLFAYRPHYKAQNRRLWYAATWSMAFVRADLLTRALGTSCLATAERGSMCAGGGFWSDRVWSDRVWLRCAERFLCDWVWSAAFSVFYSDVWESRSVVCFKTVV